MTTYSDAPAHHRLVLTASIVALAAAAWLALWTMGGSAHASMHDHHHHVTAPAASFSMLLLFVGSWTVMTIAMMLPTSLPLLATFGAVARDRRDRSILIALVVGGYLLAWSLFGAVVYAGQVAAQQIAIGSGAILLMAGIYQFTPLKHRCLDKCRSPFTFVIEHWRGRHDRWQAFRLGIDHGLFCVGCCWALMLLMFVVGMANLAWMLALGIVMAVEKNTRWGRRLSAPLGVALLAWGAVTLISF
jgi:predicted metal-binding membrane protein